MEKMEQLKLDIQGIEPDSLTDRQTDQPQTLDEKIEQSKKALLLAAKMSNIYYGKPLIVTYSGGKDSDVMLHLAETCLNTTDFEVLNSHTTVDAPETVYHIRKVFKRLNEKGIKTTIDYHKKADGTNITMWNLIPQKLMPPTRIVRYCCQELKETGTPNRICAIGVREAESSKRQGRDIFVVRGESKQTFNYFSLEHALEVHQESQEIQDDAWDCTLITRMKKQNDTIVNPIYKWLDTDIWDYIRKENIEVNPLYFNGYDRVGCIGCPFASYHQRIKEFNDYPQYKKAYIRAFDKMLEERKRRGKSCIWENGQEVFEWWMEENKHNVKGQLELDFSKGVEHED